MDFSDRFLDVLKSVDYHHDHLPRDLFANEQRLPELSPVFEWFVNNVSPKSNCVTPRERALYTSLSSKHDHFSSLDKVSEAIEKFYDETTLDSAVRSSDFDSLERRILKSQQELDDLKARGTLYEKKLKMLDDDVSLLKEKDKSTSTQCYNMENNMHSVLNSFTKEIVAFGSNVNKLYDGIEDSVTNDNFCLPKLVSNSLIGLNKSYREQICRMIQLWFREENIPSTIGSEKLKTVHTLSFIFESVTSMKQAEINTNCDLLKLNLALKNVNNIKHYFYDHKECLQPNCLDLSNYLENMKNQEIPMFNSQQQSTFSEDEIESRLCDLVVSDAEKKLSELQTTNKRITFLIDSVEHYIMMNDVVHCLMKINCSIINLKCELVLHCTSFLEKIFDDIVFAQNWVSSHAVNDGQKNLAEKATNTIPHNSVVKFSGYSSKYIDLDEIEKLSKMVQQWKSKYHFSREECNKLATLQQKLQAYGDTINKIV